MNLLLGRYFHTLRHLRWIQIYQRFYRRFRTINTDRPQVSRSRAGFEGWHRLLLADAKMNSNGDFLFLNQLGGVSSSADWKS